MSLQTELFPCFSPRYTNTRWGQVLDFPSLIGTVEIVSSGNAQEEGVAYVTRLNRLFSNIAGLPKISLLKKKIDLKSIKSLLLCHTLDTTCELSLLGGGKIYLRRGKILAPLLTREGMLVGEMQQGDCLIFLSSTASACLASEENELFSPRLTPKEIAEAVTIRLTQEQTKAEGAVALIVHFIGESPIVPYVSTKNSRRSMKDVLQQGVSWLRLFRAKPKFARYVVVVVVAILFLISVVLGIRRQQNDSVYKARQEAVNQAQQLFNEGVALTDLQPLKSREHLQNALTLLVPYTEKNLPKGKEGKAIESLNTQIQDSLKVVSKVYTANVQLFYEASFLQKDRIVSQFTVGEDELAFVDTNAGMVAVVSLLSKDAEVVAGGSEFQSTKFLAFQDKRLMLVTNDGVKAIDPGKEEVQKILSSVEGWDAFTTYGGNLYAVKKSDGMILRYPAKEGTYGEQEEYLDEDIHAELTNIEGIRIDGSVWLGSTIGKIFRYTQGRDDPFLIRGVDPPLGQRIQVSVSEEDPTVYVFDPEEKRIVLLSKEGSYQGQYVYGDTIQPTAFSVSPSKKRVFLLSSQKIYNFAIE